MKLFSSSLVIVSIAALAFACSSAAPDETPAEETGTDQSDVRIGGGGTCKAAGGKCVGLSPSSCKKGHWANATTASCGGGLGVGCCVPNTPPPPPPPPPPPQSCDDLGGTCVAIYPGTCASGNWANPASCGGGLGVGCCLDVNTCPTLSPPSPNFCPGGTIKPRKDPATNCIVGYDCVASTCPTLSPPAPNFCPGGTITPRKDVNGCTVGYDCNPPAPTNACEAGGGDCVGLSPSSCIGGTWANAATHSCGSAIGVGCCIH